MNQTTSSRGPGRPAAATREAVLDSAMRRFLRGQRVDVQAIAGELGLSRTTVYRWFGSRDDLLGEVLFAATQPLIDDARKRASGSGAHALLDTFDALNRSLAEAQPLRRFLEQEKEVALRVITSAEGRVQPRMVARIKALIEEEVERSGYEPPTDPETLAYAIVRLAEAFLYRDATLRGDVERLRAVEAALLHVSPTR